MTLKEVQRMAEVTGHDLEHIISTLPGWVQDSPEWSATVVRRFIECKEVRTTAFDRPIALIRQCGLRWISSRSLLLKKIKHGDAPPLAIHDNENDCFLRYEDAPALVPSEEIVLEGYEFEPLTLDEVDEFYFGKESNVDRIPSWALESAPWSSKIVRSHRHRGGAIADIGRHNYVIFTASSHFFPGWKSEASILRAIEHGECLPVSIRDNERDCFVRLSTEPRLVRIDPS